MRGTPDLFAAPDPIYFQADPRFTTSHDYTVAKIMAHDAWGAYLEHALAKVKNKGCFPSTLRHFDRLSAGEAQDDNGIELKRILVPDGVLAHWKGKIT